MAIDIANKRKVSPNGTRVTIKCDVCGNEREYLPSVAAKRTGRLATHGSEAAGRVAAFVAKRAILAAQGVKVREV